MLNLNQFDTLSPHEEGFSVELNLPSGEPAFLDVDAKNPKKRLTIKVKGSKASVARNISLRELREYQKSAQEEKDGVEKEETYEEMAEKAARKMAEVVISWENIPAWDGKGELEFTKEDAYKLFLKYESIRSQVIKAHENDENFIKG